MTNTEQRDHTRDLLEQRYKTAQARAEVARLRLELFRAEGDVTYCEKYYLPEAVK